MRRLAVPLAALLVLACGACCAVERQAVENLGRTQDTINAEFLKYVDNDARLDAKKRDDWRALVRSEADLRAKLGK